MNTNFADMMTDDNELLVLDIAAGNITAFYATFNSFSEMVVSDGRVIRRIEQAGGGANYAVVEEGIDPDEFMSENEADWTEADPMELLRWLENI